LRVHRGRLVLEPAERRAHCRGSPAVGVALPRVAVLELLAGDPGAPRRRAARAVVLGALADPVGRLDLARGREPDRGGVTVLGLRVRNEDPAAVVRREAGGAVRGAVPDIAGA